MNHCSVGLKFVSGALLASILLATVTLWQEGCGAPKVMGPNDQELIATFYSHRQAFERLQEMAAEDGQRGWYLGASDPSTLDPSRRSEYKRVISQIRPGLDAAMNGNTGVLRFIFAGEGSAIGPDWGKGIEYVPGDYKREGVVLPNLDKAASMPANVYLRQIEPKWFVFYQRDE